jgi:outer membrane protein assembly factor BamB
LNSIETKNGWTTSKFTGFPRKADSASKTPNATSIDLNPSYADFEVHYLYDPATNAYKRWEGGAIMTDANTGKQLEPKVVVAMVIPLSQGALDATGAYYSDYQAVGSGPVYVFQDGTVTTGTWSKAGNTSQVQFTDASNNPITLNAGQTWITALASSGKVSYK